KVMAWVAFDRAVKSAEQFGLEGPIDHWRELAAAIHDDVCRRGFDPEQGTFVQSYGSKHLDASLLLLPLVGFLPPDDPRVRPTIRACARRCKPSSGGCWSTASSCVTTPRQPMTACRPGKGPSWRAASGWSMPIWRRIAGRTRDACSIGCSVCATTSDC